MSKKPYEVACRYVLVARAGDGARLGTTSTPRHLWELDGVLRSFFGLYMLAATIEVLPWPWLSGSSAYDEEPIVSARRDDLGRMIWHRDRDLKEIEKKVEDERAAGVVVLRVDEAAAVVEVAVEAVVVAAKEKKAAGSLVVPVLSRSDAVPVLSRKDLLLADPERISDIEKLARTQMLASVGLHRWPEFEFEHGGYKLVIGPCETPWRQAVSHGCYRMVRDLSKAWDQKVEAEMQAFVKGLAGSEMAEALIQDERELAAVELEIAVEKELTVGDLDQGNEEEAE
jgi:hypothetical protein